jgi:glycosyltransferase involved in cell wall biosynthesis
MRGSALALLTMCGILSQALRVLVVLPFLPAPEGGAAARCAVGLLRGLRSVGVECEALAADDGAGPAVPDDLPVEVVPVEVPARMRSRWERLANPGGGLTRGAFARRLQARATEVDVIHYIDAHAAAVPAAGGPPAVVQIDCLTLRDRRIRGVWRQQDRVSIELLRAERRARRHARWLLTNSAEVAVELAKTRQTHVAVAPLALDPVYYPRRAPLERPVAGLIGLATWPPTANAVQRLLTRVWPQVLARRPDARLVLAGRGMEAARFPAHANLPGVEWRGEVASASELLAELGLLLYPLSAGSGTKVKVLESLALGLPVVSTPDGAEGLVDHGGVIVETEDGRIADAAVALMADAPLRAATGAQAHANFMRHHTPPVAAAAVAELYERMLT